MIFSRTFLGFSLAMVTVFLFSCTEDESPLESSSQPAWELDETYFRTSKIILNASASDGRFIVAGVDIMAAYDSSTSETRMSGYPVNNSAINYKPAIGGPYIMYAGEGGNQLCLNSLFYWYGDGSSASYPYKYYFRLSEYDVGYSDQARVPIEYDSQNIGAFNNANQYLTLISDTSQAINLNVSFCLISLTPEENLLYGKTILDISPEVLRIPIETNTSKFLSQVGSFEDVFLVSFDELYVIDPSGHVSIAQGITPGRITDIFTFNESLYAYNENTYSLYRSADKGLTWQVQATGFPARQLHFFELEDQLCFHVYSQIATVDLDTGTIEELDNAGLEGHEITSVTEYAGKVWVTTLSGMFIKPIENFFTPRETGDPEFLLGNVDIEE